MIVFPTGQRAIGLPHIEEGVRFQPAMFGQPIVIMGEPDPSPAEIAAIQTNPIKVGLYRGGVHVSFLLMELPGFNNTAEGWGDAPFMAACEPPDARTLPLREPGTGWALTFVLIDTLTQIVRAVRTSALSPEFSSLLEELIDEQVASLPQFTEARATAQVRAAYEKFPDPRQMAQAAALTEPFAVPLEEARRMRTGTRFPPNVDLYGPSSVRYQ